MPPRGAERPVYSLVIPIYNEEAVLPILLHRLNRLLERLDGPAEVIIVDEGSRDAGGIFAAGRAKDDPRYRYLALSRNFGHQIAISAGMDVAAGDAVIVMDADLQDPPEVVLDLIANSLLSGINLLMTGIVGLYVGRMHSEVKNRPLYLIDARSIVRGA